MVQNRIMLEHFTPESPDEPVKRVVSDGNIAVTWGLNNLVERIVSGTFEFSHTTAGWVQAIGIGTDSDPAFGYSEDSLDASTWTIALSQTASMSISDKGDRTLEYQATVIDTDNPWSVAEVGLFGSQGAGGNAIAMSKLAATDQVNKATGDTVNISYQLIFASA